MIVCVKCGAQNPLGSVFCRSCGSKLDLRNLNSSVVAGSTRKPWVIRHWFVFPVAAAVLLVAMLVLALWPAMAPLGKAGTRAGAMRTKSQLSGLSMVQQGQMLAPILAEKDVNAFFEHFKVPSMKVQSVTTDFRKGFFVVRIVRKLGSITFVRWRVEPRISHDVVCLPVGGRVRVRGVKMGHLPLIGPARNAAARSVHRLFAAQPEWSVLAKLDKIEVDDDRIVLTVRR
jgi:hypothetical protein